MKATFAGAERLITVNPGVTALDVQADLYSAWKTWTLTNPQYPPAFRTIGGDPLGGGLLAGSYFFLQNQVGWRVRPDERDHELVITGNLFAEDLTQPVFLSTLGGYTVALRLTTSSLTLGVDGSIAVNLQAIRAKTDLLCTRKAQPLAHFSVVMIDAEDHVSPKAGLAVFGAAARDGGPFVPLDNPVCELAHGVYTVDLTASEMDGAVITLRFTAEGADTHLITLLPEG